MASSETIAASVLDLPDMQLFRLDDTQRTRREDMLMDTSFEGVAIRAPKEVDTRSREQLPVLLAVRASGQRWQQRPLDDNAVLVATNLDTGEVFARAACVDEKAAVYGSATKTAPESKKLSATAAFPKVHLLDARGRLNLPWAPARYRLVVLCYDWVSNAVDVELIGDEPPQPAELSIAPAPSAAPVAGGGLLSKPRPPLPSYQPGKLHPKAPAEGVAIAFDPDRPGREIAVYGTFATTLDDTNILDTPAVHTTSDGAELFARAAVPVSLLFVRANDPNPLQSDFVAPVYSEAVLAAGTAVTGAFAIDAAAGWPVPTPSEKMLAYALLAGRPSGPAEWTPGRKKD